MTTYTKKQVPLLCRSLTFCAIALLLLSSCKKDNALDFFKRTGPDITETRSPGSFKRIETYDKVYVTIVQGPEFKVEVTAGKNLVKNIYTTIKDDVLRIGNKNEFNFMRSYKRKINVKVTVPRIEHVTNAGVADIVFDENYAQDTLTARMENSGDIHINGVFNQVRTSSHGNGDLYISGKSNSFYVYTNGTNFIHAEELLVSDYIFIETLSIGYCYINCSQLNEFEYCIWRSGNIYYSGTPAIIKKSGNGNGSGQAIQQ